MKKVLGLALSLSLVGCTHMTKSHFKDQSYSLDAKGKKVFVINEVIAKSCKKVGQVVSNGKAPKIKQAVSIAMKHARNLAPGQGADAILYQDVDTNESFGHYYLELTFDAMKCGTISWSGQEKSKASTQAGASAGAKSKMQASAIAAARAAASASAFASSVAASQAAAAAAAQASAAAAAAAAAAANASSIHMHMHMH